MIRAFAKLVRRSPEQHGSERYSLRPRGETLVDPGEVLRVLFRFAPLFGLAALCCAPPRAAADEGTAAPSAPAEGLDPWCADSLEALPGDVCYAPQPARDGRRTLLIFLHGLTDAGFGQQHALQVGMARAGKALGFSLLAPRGENGLGPGRRADQIAWPTAESLRAQHEDGILARIFAAKALVETREGAPFDEVFVVGFSNGAYYATSLALRGRLAVDGYAIIAGGSAASRASAEAADRKPIFVGIAGKDSTAKNGRALVALLDKSGWPHRSAEARVGHEVSDDHLVAALRYLRAEARKPR